MSTVSALSSGIQGIHSGMNNLKQDAHQIASANKGEGSLKDITKPLVGLTEDKTQIAASAKVVKAADDAIGSLLDVMA